MPESDETISELPEELELPSEVEGFSERRVELVRKAVQDWTHQLIDLGGRNNLLHYRDLKQGTLDLTSSDQKALSNLLQNRSVKISALFPDPEQREDALRRARAIHNKSRQNFEEKGLETLYLGCGLATWANKRGTWEPNAPVLFRPAHLRQLGAAQDEFELSLLEEMEVNPSLLQLLKVDFECEPDPEALLDRIEGAIDEVWELNAAYDWLRSNAQRIPDFSVQPRLVLSNFAYAKLPMVRDLENAFDQLVAHELIAAIAGDEDARENVRASDPPPESVPEPDHVPLADEFLVLDADASQNHAINAVLAGASLIIRGPPGTGKSQTISNLIATLVARGKRVLFVAEKRAAIDAVLKRLKQQRLGDLVLDLHGGVGSRRSFAQTIKNALAASRLALSVDREAELRRLENHRKELNDYVAALHTIRQPWNLSIYSVRAQLIGIPEQSQTMVRFRGDVLLGLDAEAYERAQEELATLAGLGGITLPFSGSPWANAKVESVDDVQAAFGLVDDLRRHALPAIIAELTLASGETRLPPSDTVGSWREHLCLWEQAEKTLSVFQPTVFDQDLDTLCDDMKPASVGRLTRLRAALFSGRYRGARRALQTALAGPEKLGDRELLEATRAASDLRQQWQALDPEGAPARARKPAALRESFEQVLTDLVRLANIAGTVNMVDLAADDVFRLLEDLDSDQATLVRLPEIHRLWKSLVDLGLTEFLLDMRNWRATGELCSQAFRYAWLRSILDHVSLAEVLVGGFTPDKHEEVVEEFRLGDREHRDSTPARVRRICAEQSIRARDEYREQAQIVQYQAGLKRRHMPVRSLVQTAADVLLALKPCWAMSPLIVSQLLPPKSLFNVVIFDEASQITPADAVSSILRGEQLVVAGDDRQLPPTTFFLSDTAADEEEREDAEYQKLEATELPPPTMAGTTGFESILDALPSLFRFPRTLEWHYRSRDERLIAFSNAYFYDRMLTTFPGIGGETCLKHVTVPWTPGSATNSPTPEVQAVVDLVLEHARTRPTESLGVITMGIKHANRIEEAIRQRLLDTALFGAGAGDFFSEDREERFFVKNIERVQGDERDAIILSIGYGKGERGQLVYKFGPLLQEGGERRLNVAITRAKRRLTLVSSFTFEDMDPEKLKSGGMKFLRQYLRYAETGGDNLGERILEKPALNPFEIDVRDTLAQHALKLIPQCGASGYWIDFAVQHPTVPGRFVLALECDGASYHSSRSARDRDRLRQEQLERLGWRFHRIWSTEWFYNKEAAVWKVLAAYQEAISEPPEGDSESSEPENHSTAADPREPAKPGVQERDGPRPPVKRHQPITDYSRWELVRLVRWIESDGLLRTEDELLADVMADLGFARRGNRIVAAVRAAIKDARR